MVNIVLSTHAPISAQNAAGQAMKRTGLLALTEQQNGLALRAGTTAHYGLTRGAATIFVAAIFVFMSAFFGVQSASAETRTLNLFYINTGEKTSITFKRNGRYIASGLTKLNKFLRDWRRKESIKMDPRLFDLVWEVHKATGSRRAIHVVSAYRSPATNQMLRRTRGGQATKSQHMVGKAMDFYIPGVSSSKIRKIGLKKAWGGVGYYPRSSSPYVHLDTGRTRHWPRMNRRELTALFPNGRTLHVPTDGKPLKNYKQAQADDRRIRAGKSPTGGGGGTGLLAAIGLGGGDEDEDKVNIPAPTPVRTAAVPRTAPTLAIPGASASTPGFDGSGPSATNSLVPPAAIGVAPQQPDAPVLPAPSAPVVLPESVAAPRINPRAFTPITPDGAPVVEPVAPSTPATTVTPEGLPVPEGPLTPNPVGNDQILVARAPTEDETLGENVTATFTTEILPRQRPGVELEAPVIGIAPVAAPTDIPVTDPTANEETTLVGFVPQARPALPASAGGIANKFNKTETSPRFNNRLQLAHAYQGAASPIQRAETVLRALENTSIRQGSQPATRTGISDNAPPATQLATATIPVTPQRAPRLAQASEPVSQPVAAPVTTTASTTKPASSDGNLLIAEPKFDAASATEFTQDGSMAIGALNGATVVGWALTPLDPIKVQARGLRAPAYGQNTLRIAPAKVLQQKLETIGSEPEWTRIDGLQRQAQTHLQTGTSISLARVE
jgi:uncharacterized protein YcbK (DUF882 family)/cytoskeletal protein RodZ